MPLSTTELREEQLGQLSRLVQSPGWGLYRTRVEQCVVRNELVKAKLLRELKLQEAAQLQSRLDGLREALDLMDQYIDSLGTKSELDAAY